MSAAANLVIETMQSTPLQVVPMTLDHVPAVFDIEQQLFDDPWSAKLFRAELSHKKDRSYFVATVEGVVVGYIGVLFVEEDAHIANVATDPNWQRQGIAKHLLLAALRSAIAHDCQHATLEVRAKNTYAQQLYFAFGFQPAGTRKKYYRNGEDALILWANDISSQEFAQRLARIDAQLHEVVL